MSTIGDKTQPFHFDRHAPDYLHRAEELTHELHAKCPVAWTETHGGHWVVSGYDEVFEIARAGMVLSNDHDVEGKAKGYKGITIPSVTIERGGFLEMDPPEQRDYRHALDPYLSPAAVVRWKPMVADLTHACIDEKIESGEMDFVDDLANVVPAVMTLGLMGLPLVDWTIYCEPTHAQIYTPPGDPSWEKVFADLGEVRQRLLAAITEQRTAPRPGLVSALIQAPICGAPASDTDILGALTLLIGGGFDTTTALTAHSLEWLSQNPAERQRLIDDLPGLIDSATEEFLRFYTPAPGDGRTVTCEYSLGGKQLQEGDRLWVSWSMANRDPSMFPDPDVIKLDRKHNRHTSFGLGLHRCIGSNVARAVYKTMLTGVLERIPDFVCDSSRAVHYDTIGTINGMKHLPATFAPGRRVGPSLDETIAHWQQVLDETGMAGPVTRAEASGPGSGSGD